MAAYAKLAGRFTVTYPEVFGSVEPGLFQSVIDKFKPDAHPARMKDQQ